jgi:hypothetical protein
VAEAGAAWEDAAWEDALAAVPAVGAVVEAVFLRRDGSDEVVAVDDAG